MQHQLFTTQPIKTFHCLDILAWEFHWETLCCRFMPGKLLKLHSSMALRVWKSMGRAKVPVKFSWVCCGSYFWLCYVKAAASDDRNVDEGSWSTCLSFQRKLTVWPLEGVSEAEQCGVAQHTGWRVRGDWVLKQQIDQNDDHL